MARKKPSTGIPAPLFMAQGFNGGTRAPIQTTSEREHPEAGAVSAIAQPAPAQRLPESPFTCPECGSHEAYLLRDTLLRVTRYEPDIKAVEVESVGELTLDVECKNCRCVVELGEDWTVVEKGQVAS